jgi:hypothetical protein
VGGPSQAHTGCARHKGGMASQVYSCMKLELGNELINLM